MNHVAHRANSILQKPSSNSEMHWLRLPHSCMHWLGSPILACIDSGVNKCILYSVLQMILHHCVFKWRHSVKILPVIWKALIKGFHLRYNTIWFLQFQNLSLGYTMFDPGANHEGQRQSALKTNQQTMYYFHTKFEVDPIKILQK
jgi:hypothetical protein